MSASDLAFEVNTVIDDIDEITGLIKVALAMQRRPHFPLGQDPLEEVVGDDFIYNVSWLGYDLLSRKERLARMRDSVAPTDDKHEVPFQQVPSK